MTDHELAELEASIRRQQWALDASVQLHGYPNYEGLMKVIYKTPNGRLTFEQDGLDRKKAFEFVSAVQELFEEPCCGGCQSTNIQCRVREHDGNKFYNLVCTECGCQADFGQRKDGTGMWLKRTDKDGHALVNKGWYKWQRGGEERSEQTQDRGYEERRNPPPPTGADIPF